MNKFNKIHIAMKYWLYGRNFHGAIKAMEFAGKYHIGIRKDGVTPEFHHQISIASYLRTLSGIRFQEEVLAVAFLHDLIEDYKIGLKVISTEFGEIISNAVDLLSRKDESGKFKERDVSCYFEKMSKCPIASVVKGGDRIHNFQTMSEVFHEARQREYIKECEEYILPMLKEARRRFPEQEPAYENIKLVLISQIELLNISLRYGS